MTRGLVLGAGGVLGSAWMIGALVALREHAGFEPGEADVVVGTSAGSVLAALAGAGIGADVMLRHQKGIVVEGDPRIDYDHATGSGGALPPLPRPRVGSPALMARVARRPWRYSPLAALSAITPPGRGDLGAVGHLVGSVADEDGWVGHPATWIVAMDYDTGRRVPFGRPGAPPASLVAAVTASCAIPGWYAPVQIDGRRYVDGGTCSPTSADLLANRGLDIVYVLAPMASFDYDEPAAVGARLERRLRRAWTKRLLREVAKVRRGGAAVTVLAPGRADLEAIGANLMDPRRRRRVLETSLRTSAAALRAAPADRRAG